MIKSGTYFSQLTGNGQENPQHNNQKGSKQNLPIDRQKEGDGMCGYPKERDGFFKDEIVLNIPVQFTEYPP